MKYLLIMTMITLVGCSYRVKNDTTKVLPKQDVTKVTYPGTAILSVEYLYGYKTYDTYYEHHKTNITAPSWKFEWIVTSVIDGIIKLKYVEYYYSRGSWIIKPHYSQVYSYSYDKLPLTIHLNGYDIEILNVWNNNIKYIRKKLK